MRLDHLLSKENMGREDFPYDLGQGWKTHVIQFRGYRSRGARDGGLAQLGERLPCKQEVSGSNPLISTRETVGERSEGKGSVQRAKCRRVRKAALGNMRGACCNRRGFSGEKRTR